MHFGDVARFRSDSYSRFTYHRTWEMGVETGNEGHRSQPPDYLVTQALSSQLLAPNSRQQSSSASPLPENSSQNQNSKSKNSDILHLSLQTATERSPHAEKAVRGSAAVRLRLGKR